MWKFRSKINSLFKHSDTAIARHTAVRGEASIFDGKLTYWAKRVKSHPMLNNTELRLMKSQQGVCTFCNDRFYEGNVWQIDHIIPLSIGGKKEFKNLQLLHSHCHLIKSRNERHEAKLKRARDCAVNQERDEVKISRPVLKTSGNREVVA